MQPLWRAEERHRGCTHAAVDFHTSHHIINFEGQHLVHVHTRFILMVARWNAFRAHRHGSESPHPTTNQHVQYISAWQITPHLPQTHHSLILKLRGCPRAPSLTFSID